ncbi:hypothetical protein PoHVEF18_006987 [Penicillium ochrochloron]
MPIKVLGHARLGPSSRRVADDTAESPKHIHYRQLVKIIPTDVHSDYIARLIIAVALCRRVQADYVQHRVRAKRPVQLISNTRVLSLVVYRCAQPERSRGRILMEILREYRSQLALLGSLTHGLAVALGHANAGQLDGRMVGVDANATRGILAIPALQEPVINYAGHSMKGSGDYSRF